MSLQEDIRHFIVRSFLSGEEGLLNIYSSFLSEGIVDSTGVVQLMAFIEEKYQVTIEDEELTSENLDLIRKITLFIKEKMRLTEPVALCPASGLSS